MPIKDLLYLDLEWKFQLGQETKGLETPKAEGEC